MPRCLALLLAVAAIGHAGAVSAQLGQVPTWRNAFTLVPTPGNEAWYADAFTGEPRFRLTVAGLQDGAAVLTLTEPGQSTPWWRTLAATSAEGDVLVLAEAEGDGPFVPFPQPLPIVDAPLFAGKGWSVGWSDGCLDNGPGPLHSWGVDTEEDVIVPAGQYHCYRVRYHHICSWGPADCYWYAEGVGLVKMALLSGGFGPGGPQTYVLMSAPVQDATATWGDVKALYR